MGRPKRPRRTRVGGRQGVRTLGSDIPPAEALTLPQSWILRHPGRGKRRPGRRSHEGRFARVVRRTAPPRAGGRSAARRVRLSWCGDTAPAAPHPEKAGPRSPSTPQCRDRTCRSGPHGGQYDNPRGVFDSAQTPGPPRCPPRQLCGSGTDRRPPSPAAGGGPPTR